MPCVFRYAPREIIRDVSYGEDATQSNLGIGIPENDRPQE
jgi:hypothetical protein